MPDISMESDGMGLSMPMEGGMGMGMGNPMMEQMMESESEVELEIREMEEDAEEEEDIDGEEEEDVDGEGEEDLDEEEGGEGETLIATSSLFTFAQKAHISIVALHKIQCSFTIGCACFKNAANTASFISSINVFLQGNFWSPGEGYLYSHTSKPSVVGNYRSFEVSDLSCSLESFMTIDSKTND